MKTQSQEDRAFIRACMAPETQMLYDEACKLGIAVSLGALPRPVATASTPSRDYEFMSSLARTKHVAAPAAAKRESTLEVWARTMRDLHGVGAALPDKKVTAVAVEAPKAIPDRSKTEAVWARQFRR